MMPHLNGITFWNLFFFGFRLVIMKVNETIGLNWIFRNRPNYSNITSCGKDLVEYECV